MICPLCSKWARIDSSFSKDRGEPPHVHVERDDDGAKFWLSPVRLDRNDDFPSHELKKIEDLIKENEQYLLERRNELFNQ
jgi:hypothetical protein